MRTRSQLGRKAFVADLQIPISHFSLSPFPSPSSLTSLPPSQVFSLRTPVSLPARRRRTPGALGRAGLEAILEFARHVLEGAHAARAGRLSSLGLETPVVCSEREGLEFGLWW